MTGLPTTAWARLSVVAGGYLATAELDRLLGACLGPAGVPATAHALLGPLGVRNIDAWSVWRESAYAGVATRVLLLYLAAWLVLVVVAMSLLHAWLSPFGAGTAPARRVVVAVAGLTVAQVVVAVAAAVWNTHGAVPTVLRGVVAVVTVGLWLAVAVLVVLLLRTAAARARLLAGAVRWGRALYVQRLSLVVVLVLGVLTLNPGPDVADQLPDVVRRWLDLSTDATRHLLLAVVTTGLTAAGLFVVGRLRTERAWTEAVGGVARPDGKASRLWLAWPVLAVVAAAALAVTRTQTSFDWRFALAVVVPVGVFVASRCVRKHVELPDLVPASTHGEGWARTVWRAGDALAGAVVVLLGLALLRAFTAPAVLGPPSTTDPLAGSRQAWEVAAVLGGVAVTAGAPLLLHRLVRRIDAELLARATAGATFRWSPLWPPVPAAGALTPWAWAVGAAGVAALAGLALWPVGASSLLGVFAVAELALLAWAVVVGLVLVHLQHRQPAEVFRLLRLRYNPVMTLALAVPLVASLSGGDPTVHEVRPAGAAPAGTQTQAALTTLTQQWLTSGAGCDIPLEGSAGGGATRVQPLVLLAADGGGIRASRWTVEAVRRFTDAWRSGAPDCGRAPLLLASGVSGGSVGLALSGGVDDARADQRALEGPEALGAAAVGLLVRDMLAGGAGLKVPAVDAGGAWTDRAGLMESVWEGRSSALRRPFTVTAEPGRPALVFNAAAAGLGCRVLVAQADVRADPPPAATAGVTAPPAGEQRVADCRGRTDLPAGTLDLWQSYGSCLPTVSRATAAMLSARFAVVTPAARVRGCGGLPDLQLVDGGYGEGSGLGTLDEVLPTVLDAVRGANAAGAGAGPGRTVVVPVVVFLQNRPGADVSAPPPGLSAELLVPLSGGVAKDVQSNTGAWLQRASTQLLGACPRADVPCQTALARFWRTMPGGVVVVAPAAQPAVEPPLGWTLSAASRIRLVTAMDRETTTCRDPRTTGILGNYGRFGALLSWLRDRRECGGDTR